ncbi:MAG: cobalt ECF transporter T component CbiQ [Myxococcales bacterium]|nr:cobalt ECF transporter T component CbiQ [Myxococcales bacterium]
MSFEIDAHAALPSPIQRWDPRVKIASLTILAVAIATCRHAGAAVLGVAMALETLALARLPVDWVLGRLKAPLAFLALFFVVLPFSGAGTTIPLGGLRLSVDGMELAALLVLKGTAVVLVTLALLGTAPFHRSMRALEDLGVPARLVELLLFAYRYVFVFARELERKRLALRARGFSGRRARDPRTAARIVGTLMVSGLDQTERVQRAMRLRGYAGRIPTLERFAPTGVDFAKAAAAAAAALAILMADRLPP